RVRRLAARHIDPDAIEGGHPLAKARAVLVGVVPGALQLPPVEVADALARLAQRAGLLARQRLQRLLQLFPWHLELGQRARRADTGMISSTGTRPLARKVLPVETRSTIASARPTSGASSIDPYRRIRSTCTPFAAKCSRVMLTYLVATRRRAPCRTAPA